MGEFGGVRKKLGEFGRVWESFGEFGGVRGSFGKIFKVCESFRMQIKILTIYDGCTTTYDSFLLVTFCDSPLHFTTAFEFFGCNTLRQVHYNLRELLQLVLVRQLKYVPKV